MENFSRSVVRYLRHDHTAPIDENAYVQVFYLMKYFHVSFYQLQEAVHQPTDKQRLFISSCRKFIRAAAGGHSIPVNLTNFAQSNDDQAQVRYRCHGSSLHAYSQIKEEGLKTMTRQYIRFASPRELLKKNSKVVITLNVKKYLQQGMQRFFLQDGNIDATGNRKGIIKPCFFQCVTIK